MSKRDFGTEFIIQRAIAGDICAVAVPTPELVRTQRRVIRERLCELGSEPSIDGDTLRLLFGGSICVYCPFSKAQKSDRTR